jgi:HAE1 family hydrophobic/amphiphilic exporter-1
LIGRLVAHSNISDHLCIDPDCGCRLRPVAGADRFYSDRRPRAIFWWPLQLPDGAALDRTQHVLTRVSEITGKAAGVEQVITIAGISALRQFLQPRQCRRGLSHPQGVERARRKGEDLRSLFVGLERETVR